jgi:hypothetical protein
MVTVGAHLTQCRSQHAAAVVAAAVMLTACPRLILPAQPEGAKPGCTFNADCPDEQVCAAGSCREQCQTDRDCVSPATCRPSSQRNVRICLRPEDPPLCVYNSDCVEPLICARDGLCRAPCQEDRDCGAGTCIADQGVCSAVDGGSVLVETDAGFLTCRTGCDFENGQCETALNLGSIPQARVALDPMKLPYSGLSCVGERTGFFRYSVTEPSLVTVRAFGACNPTSLGWLDNGCASNAARCTASVEACGATLWDLAAPGERWVAVSLNYPSTVEFSQLPLPGNASVIRIRKPLTPEDPAFLTQQFELQGEPLGHCGATGPSVALMFDTDAEWTVDACSDQNPPLSMARLTPGNALRCVSMSAVCSQPAVEVLGVRSVGVLLVSGMTPQDTGRFTLKFSAR